MSTFFIVLTTRPLKNYSNWLKSNFYSHKCFWTFKSSIKWILNVAWHANLPLYHIIKVLKETRLTLSQPSFYLVSMVVHCHYQLRDDYQLRMLLHLQNLVRRIYIGEVCDSFWWEDDPPKKKKNNANIVYKNFLTRNLVHFELFIN